MVLLKVPMFSSGYYYKEGTAVNTKQIYVTDFDKQRLMNLIKRGLHKDPDNYEYLQKLLHELELANVVGQKDIPHNVITMNSEFLFEDVKTGEKFTYQLVYPESADINKGKISVLSPVGKILLGYKTGDTVECTVPAGLKKFKILQIIYQPEAAGDYNL